jgi:pyruvate formate lyase activating enzyme
MTIQATQGCILHLQRLSTEDGPGIRTTVFFKGCPLHCAWCHNPESISPAIQNQWFATRCLDCHTCLETCPNGCLTMTHEGLVIDRTHCQMCGACSEACPAGAIEALGKTVTVDDLMVELLKDRAFYEKSGGGVTLSGGEPTLQADFSEALLRRLKEEGVATALDTCGMCTTHTLERLLPFTDLVLYDLKLFDNEQHRKYAGQPNTRILSNLLYIRDFIREQTRTIDLWIRTPLIPGATATQENISALGKFITSHLDGSVSRWELCAFNNLCRDQYTRLGMEWDFAQTPLMTNEEVGLFLRAAKHSGVDPEIIRASGATRETEKSRSQA